MICIFCGKENDNNAVKCKYCGFVFEKPSADAIDREPEEASVIKDNAQESHSQNNYVTNTQNAMPQVKRDDPVENSSPIIQPTSQAHPSYNAELEKPQNESKKLPALESILFVVGIVLSVAAITVLVVGIIMSRGSGAILDIPYAVALGIKGVLLLFAAIVTKMYRL